MASALFVEYRETPMILEQVLSEMFADHGIRGRDQQDVCAFLSPLKHKGFAYFLTYEHSIRVAKLGEQVAKFVHLDPKVLIFAGLLHDIGKVQVPASTLGKTSGWTAQDSENMEPHVIDSYRSIRGRFDFTAEVVLWHHQFQAKPYPKVMPEPTHSFCKGSHIMFPYYGRLLSLCDQFDASHRVNDKHGTMCAPSGDEIRDMMYKLNPDQKHLLDDLYEADIFTTYTAPLPTADQVTQ